MEANGHGFDVVFNISVLLSVPPPLRLAALQTPPSRITAQLKDEKAVGLLMKNASISQKEVSFLFCVLLCC